LPYTACERFLVLWLTVAVLLAPALLAQSAGTGALTGTVTDPSGAVVPNVIVTLTSNNTGQIRTAATDAAGSYRFALLAPGTYKVNFSAMGFKIAEIAAVTVNVTETPVVNRALEVGAQTESVVVQAEAAQLQTADSTLGTVFTGNTITELPLVSRNFTQVLGLEAGVSSDLTNGSALGRGTSNFAVNGGTVNQNNYQMDGNSIINNFNSGAAADTFFYVGIAIPQPDAITEFKVQTSTYDASYGRNPGANVNVVTKSGTNQYHGTLFEFFRNEDLNANSFFENALNGGKQQVLKQNQFGGTFGGPIKKDKLFFFGGYQGTRQRNGIDPNSSKTVHLPPIPAGDRSAAGFQAALGAAMCSANHPGNSNYLTYGQANFGGVGIKCDGSNINPVALAILRVKLPDGSYYVPGSTTGNYQTAVYSVPSTYSGDQYIGNFDYLLSSKHTLQGRYFFTEDPLTYSFAVPQGGTVPGSPTNDYYSNTVSNLKLTSVISPTLVNIAGIAFARNIGTVSTTNPWTPSQVGMTALTASGLTPVIAISNAYSLDNGGPVNWPSNKFTYSDQISWTHGQHTVRAGAEFEADQLNLSFNSTQSGILNFNGFDDFLLGSQGCAAGTYPSTCSGTNPGNTNGSPFSSILSCGTCIRSGAGGIIHEYRQRDVAAYVQDDWKVNNHLTLNLGVRWEYDGILSDNYGGLTNTWLNLLASVPVPSSAQASGNSLVGYVVPSNFAAHFGQPPAGVTVSGNNETAPTGIPKNNFGPRFGFAWQPMANGKFVVRGGVGMFYDRVGGSQLVMSVIQSVPYALNLQYTGAAGAPYNLANPFPSTQLGFTPRWYNFSTMTGSNLSSNFYSNIHTPLTRSYNLNVQYQFLPNWLLEVGFVGSSGINQLDSNHAYDPALLASASNPVNGITTNTIANASARVAYPGYQPMGLLGTAFDRAYNYNSLQATVRKRFSYGLQLQAAYTWSKNLTNLVTAPSDYSGPTSYGVNLNNVAGNVWADYGQAGFSRPQVFVFNYSYDLPFNPKGRFSWLGRGWTLAGVVTIQDGNPITFTDVRGGSVFTGATGNSTAQLCAGATYASTTTSGSIESRLSNYFNKSAFCNPIVIGSDGLATAYGNSGLGVVSGPGEADWDASILKNTKLTERQTIQFRTEFFNLTNHPNFGDPSAVVSTSSTFGQITTTRVNPRLIQFSLKYLF